MDDTYPHVPDPVTYQPKKPIIRWPVYAITVFVGLFVLVVMGIWVVNHLLEGEPIDQTAWIVLGACLLRSLTIVIALASVQPWGNKLPQWVVLGGLSGSASAQLIYPIAEAVGKLLIIAGLLESSGKGLGNMTPTGWFNFAAVWVIFGIPGMLFVKAARNYKNRKSSPITWVWIGGVLGIVALLLIGVLIG